MTAVPFDWNVIVAGDWNLAILTPNGIVRRLFQADPATGIEVQVAVDGLAPMRVVHSGILVAPAPKSLTVQPQTSVQESLLRAATIARQAVTSLRETPLTAAGVNIRYRFDALPPVLSGAVHSEAFDDLLAGADHSIKTRRTKRSLRWRNGELNLEVIEDDNGSGAIVLNFHRGSTSSDDLAEWLGYAELMLQQTRDLLGTTLGVTLPTET